jgi:hypothetical protein
MIDPEQIDELMKKRPMPYLDGEGEPTLRLLVCGDGSATIKLVVRLNIDERDGSMWRLPISLSLSPVYIGDVGEIPREDLWETLVDMRREDARLLADFLYSLLKTPDWRAQADDQEEEEAT